jgi:hypothetical protein
LISQPEFGSDLKVISDHSNLDGSELTAADVAQIADLRMAFTGETGMRSAVVVGPNAPLKFGLARMFEAYAGSKGDDSVKVFETVEEAMAWLEATE